MTKLQRSVGVASFTLVCVEEDIDLITCWHSGTACNCHRTRFNYNYIYSTMHYVVRWNTCRVHNTFLLMVTTCAQSMSKGTILTMIIYILYMIYDTYCIMMLLSSCNLFIVSKRKQETKNVIVVSTVACMTTHCEWHKMCTLKMTKW